MIHRVLAEMDDDIYEGFGSIGGDSRFQLSSAVSPESVTSFRSDASNSRTFARPALSMASARNTASARPPSSLYSTRQPLTADPGVTSSARGTYHYGEVTLVHFVSILSVNVSQPCYSMVLCLCSFFPAERKTKSRTLPEQ